MSNSVGVFLVTAGTFSANSFLALAFLVEKVQILLIFDLVFINFDVRIHRVFQKGRKTKELFHFQEKDYFLVKYK